MLATIVAAALLPVAGVFPAAPAPQSLPTRPRDIWAFRSVLDDRARMLTLALHEDLWAAYDATNCGLYRAWKGGVKFDGAVYTTVHGPQPTTLGAPQLPGIVDRPVWQLRREGRNTPLGRAEFKGYRIRRQVATLQYRFRMSDQREILVFETPEVRRLDPLTVEFERRFEVRGLRTGEQLGLSLLVRPAGTTTDAELELPPSQEFFRPGTLWLRNGRTVLRAVLPAGSNEESVYAEAGEEADSVNQEPAAREPGVSLRVYFIGQPLSAIPKLIAGQTPNYSALIPNIDLRKPEHWGPERDQFYAKASGFLNIREPGEYQFRLTSDDGSIFMIRDEVIVNHDGLHSADPPKTGRFVLAAGEHPFAIEFFEEGGDETLVLEWRRPGSNAWEVVPPSAFTTLAGEVRVTAPGKKLIFDPNKRSRPGDGRPLEGVHPAFDLETVRPKDFQPRVGGMDFLPDGRLVVCTWDPDGAVYVLDGVRAAKPHNVRVKRIAAGLAEPLGLKVVNGAIYVLQKQELTKLVDHDGDGVTDEYFAVANGWGVTSNFHEFAFGLLYDKGFFYGTLATAIDPGGRSTQPQNPDRGMVVKIDPRTGDYSLAASGLRTPNGIGFGYGGRIFITDNQGDWLPSSKILAFREGAFYGNRSVDPVGKASAVEDPPVCWLPQNEIGNSPSTPAPLNVGPYRNQMIHGDVTHGGVKRVFVEEVDGVLQGCVFRFTQGLEAGINRLVWGPDGALYVGGIGSTGNWGQEGKERFGLQRLAYNGAAVFEMLAVRALSNGLEIEFTQPLMAGLGKAPGDYTVRMWRYEPTAEYGGPKVDERELAVRSVTVSGNRRRAFLEIPGLKSGHVVYVRLNRGLASTRNEDLWSTEAWYTLNRIPAGRMGKVGPQPPVNALAEEERRQGFRLLFDGRTAEHFRGYRKAELPPRWKVLEGALQLVPGTGAGGDIVTRDQFGDFELRFEWKIEPGGNSGVFIRSSEQFAAGWHTGPEFQILDDDLAPDGRNPITSAGSNYGILARSRDMVRPAGQWNEFRIIARGTHVENWMNGYKVVELELGSAAWKELVKASKFNPRPEYGTLPKGHIVFQDHGNRVAFRNIRIRELPSSR